MSNEKDCSPIYNDQKHPVNREFLEFFKKCLEDNGMPEIAQDARLMNHFGHMFIRETAVLFNEDFEALRNGKNRETPEEWIKSTNLKDNQHVLFSTRFFENIQSTIYNSTRFKPSANFETSNSWLVEFRVMDAPITAREKTYFTLFSTLFQRIITDPKLQTNFYIPISFSDRNHSRGIRRNAVRKQRFYFRRYFYGEKCDDARYQCSADDPTNVEEKREKFKNEMLVELTLEELFEGGESHQGFKGLIKAFIELNKAQLLKDSQAQGEDVIKAIWDTFHFFENRVRGETLTSAGLQRWFIHQHPLYKSDSVVEGQLRSDFISFMLKVQKENNHPRLFKE